ncbi:hypothetical protein [Consotaella salsifontis]|uniref:Uncharacterized protein n=1 Tax=Consotaella salsifontis TaxID=1365950 RepID=A0A1T4RLC8_9HYPH|nr:hypothetical protein [Consotaella salsifontis]SKA16707.1 hypothetical protein SAMN05428963_10741 [Consotaella salsifontis]
MMRYNPSRGGHAPSNLRHRFEILIARYVRGGAMRLDDLQELFGLSGQLWNCTDPLSIGLYASEGATAAKGVRFNMALRTYAEASRYLRRHLRSHKPRVRIPTEGRPPAA